MNRRRSPGPHSISPRSQGFRRTAWILISLLALLHATQRPARSAELPGRALHDRILSDGRLQRSEGVSRLEWTLDGKGHRVFEDGMLFRVDAITGEKTPLFDREKLLASYSRHVGKETKELPFRDLSFLQEGKKIRFAAERKVFLYDVASGDIVSWEPEKPSYGVRGHRYDEVLSPDLTRRAFVRDWNLHVKDLEGNETALTTDGTDDLRNGFPDWVYAEELYQFEAFWWSPDSKRIAFLQFDQSPVARYPIVHDTSPIPRLDLQRYPKSGANNPIVRLFVVEVASRKIVRIDSGIETNVYLYKGRWTPDGKAFTYFRLARLQNAIEMLAADPETGASRVVLRDEDPCYIDENIDRVFLSDGKRFVWMSERTGWLELYLHDMDGTLIRQLTDARLPVDRILGVDEKAGVVWFSGFETRGTELHLYRVGLDGSGFKKMTWKPGQHRISMAPGFELWTDSFTSFDEPRRTTLHFADGAEIRELGRSSVTQAYLDLNLVPPERFTFRSADGQHDLDAVLYKPVGFDEGRKYPLVLSVYGGPASKMVRNEFHGRDGNQALAQLGFLVAIQDHRGASGRGKAFQNLMFRNLGQVELADHVALVRHLGARPYVDTSRVGIHGHSYGGYLTCMALLAAPDTFHVGVAGAPVTDWRNYDTIYAERYMQRPQDNPDGYAKGSCLTHARNLKGWLSIHHGAVDDNVHPGNSVQLIEALLREDKRFDFMLYPGQDHGIGYRRYGESRLEYLVEHLRPDPPGGRSF